MNDRNQALAVDGAGAAPLTKRQQMRLIVDHLRPAFEAMRARGALTAAERFEDWRREETWKAVGKQSLRACTQRDFGWIVSHCKGLAGDLQGQRRARARAAANPDRQAMHVLKSECAKAAAVLGDARGYVRHIAKCKYKRAVDDCNAKQLWGLVFDVRRAAAKKRRGGGKGLPPSMGRNAGGKS